MNNKQTGNTAIIVLVVVAIFMLGVWWFWNQQNQPKEAMVVQGEPIVEPTSGTLNASPLPANGNDEAMTQNSGYVKYSETAFVEAEGQDRIYFFHAGWCPTCKVADRELTERQSEIPENVVVFKTDYDNSQDILDEYAVTYQHTFVHVDQDGNEISQWNGGGLDQLLENI